MEQIQIRLLMLMSWILMPIFVVIIGGLIFLAVKNVIKKKVSIPNLIISAVVSVAIAIALKWAIGTPPLDIPAGLRGLLVSFPYATPVCFLIIRCAIFPLLSI